MNQTYLLSILHYDPLTGVFTWISKTAIHSSIKVGTRAGSHDGQGYRRITINGRTYQEHRLAWLYVHGRFPPDMIDHINGVSSDNRICNLREATISENGQNRKRGKNNTSGFTGVSWHKSKNKWCSQIRVNGDLIALGSFDTPQEANDAYLLAKSKLHPFNPIPR